MTRLDWFAAIASAAFSLAWLFAIFAAPLALSEALGTAEYSEDKGQ